MKFIEIDERKCKHDGICASECPFGVIRLKNKTSFPEVIPGGEDICLLCGHCVAACPHGALNHQHIPLQKSPPVRKDLLLNLEQAVQFLRSRRSIRQYRDEPVEKEKIQKLIEIARYAPTSGNTQLVEWWVFTDRNEISHFSDMVVQWIRRLVQTVPQSSLPPYFPSIVAGWDNGQDLVLRNTPVLLLALAPAKSPNGLVDLTIALSYLELAAMPMGLGTCWAGLVQGALQQWTPLKQAVGLPEKSPHHYPMMLGYPRIHYHRVPERKPPRITWR